MLRTIIFTCIILTGPLQAGWSWVNPKPQVRSPPQFSWAKLSLTDDTPSLLPVNAGGRFTVFADLPTPPPSDLFEIYYKIRRQDPLNSISQSPSVRSFNPHSVVQYTATLNNLYTVWLENNDVPYEIKCRKLELLLDVPAYLTSRNGYETPSPYLIARDSFISDWQIPVDIGSEKITYRFSLKPNFRYKIKVVLYHESSGEWREWIKIDGKLRHLIKYNVYEPETLEFWIAPAYYQDGMIEVCFKRVVGSVVSLGLVYIYQYEPGIPAGPPGGPMAQGSGAIERSWVTASPNPFRNAIGIKGHMVAGRQQITIQIYDVAGCLVKRLYDDIAEDGFSINWRGVDENGHTVAPGIYILAFTNLDTKATFCRKIIKVE